MARAEVVVSGLPAGLGRVKVPTVVKMLLAAMTVEEVKVEFSGAAAVVFAGGAALGVLDATGVEELAILVGARAAKGLGLVESAPAVSVVVDIIVTEAICIEGTSVDAGSGLSAVAEAVDGGVSETAVKKELLIENFGIASVVEESSKTSVTVLVPPISPPTSRSSLLLKERLSRLGNAVSGATSAPSTKMIVWRCMASGCISCIRETVPSNGSQERAGVSLYRTMKMM